MNVIILKEKLDALADAIGIKSKKRVPATIDDLTEIVETSFELQEKTVAPATEAQSVEADEGYYGISRVDIDKMKLEHASATLTATGQAFTPSEGYDGMSDIYVFPRSLAGNAYIDAGYATVSGQFRWRARGRYYVSAAGWRSTGNYYGSYTNYAAIPTGTTVTPTESAQTIGGTNTMMQGAVTVNPIPSEYIVPTGTKSITQNGTGIDVASFESVDVNVSGGGQPTLQSKTYNVSSAGTATVTADSGYDGLSEVEVSVPSADPFTSLTGNQFITENNQRKWTINAIAAVDVEDGDVEGWLPDGFSRMSTYKTNAVPSNTSITPTESAQTIGGTRYMMEGAVTVNAIPSNYVGSGITQRSSSDLTASGATVTVPSGYYSAQASKSVASGTAGTPTATKGTVSNHSVSVTPSVTNTSGYITGSTKTGTAVTVSASELVSGDLAITQNGNAIDCANYSTVSVNVPSSGADCPMFTATYDSTRVLSSITCDKTFAECSALNTDHKSEAVLKLVYPPDELRPDTTIVYVGLTNQSASSSTSLVYTGTGGWDAGIAYYKVEYLSNGTINWSEPPAYTDDQLSITANGTYTAPAGTYYTSVVANVSSGSSEWTHIAHTTMTVNTTSTSAGSAGTIACGSSIADKNKIIYVRIRDTQGARAGYFAGSDAYFMNYNKANGSTSAFSVPAVMCYRYTTSSQWAGTAGQYGVYGYSISNAGVLTVRRRYNANYSLTVNSTYDVDVFTLDYPSGYPAVFDL